MGKFRHRFKGKSKKPKKGQSASCNAETTKFREAARSAFFRNTNENSALTTDALVKHDAIVGKRPISTPSSRDGLSTRMEEDGDGGSSNATSFVSYKSFASDWSECSNISFSRVLDGFRPDSALHKEMLAILAALTEVIKNQNGKESNVEYFAALMTTLESTENEVSMAAVLSLLAMNIRSVPSAVLKAKFNDIAKSFIEILAKYVDTENLNILKSLIGCITNLLRNQNPSAWSNSTTLDLLNFLLSLCLHSKPKIRKPAHLAVAAILRQSRFLFDVELGWDNKRPHPASSHVAKYCTEQILANSSSGKNATTSILHLLSMLTNIIETFPHEQLKTCCETILRLMTLPNVILTSCCLQVLHALFESRPQTWCMPLTLNGQILTALYDYQPPRNDTQPTLAWLTVMTEAHLNLAKLKRKTCVTLLPRIFSVFTELWLSDRSEVMNSVSCSLANFISECFSKSDDGLELSEIESYVSTIITDLSKCLGFQYHAAWKDVLQVHLSLFQHCGPLWPQLLTPTLIALAKLRDSSKFTYPNELERVIMAAVKSMGPEIILEIIPLKLSENANTYDFERSWMIPVLKASIRRARLQFFNDYFLPLAFNCKKQSEEASAKKDRVATFSYGLLYSQIWSLFPSFCNQPTDIVTSFKDIARTLGDAINNFKELRMIVLNGLRRLLSQASDDADIKNEMGRFAKNFLPILFNHYVGLKPQGSDEEAIHLALFETIKLYLTVAPSDQIDILYNKALDKLPEPGNEKPLPKKGKSKKNNDKMDVDKINENKEADQEGIHLRTCILDIVRAFVPFQKTRESIMVAYIKAAKPGIALYGRHLHIVQKKSYLLMEAILDQPLFQEDIEFHKEVRQEITQLVAVVSTSSKVARLRCLKKLLNNQENFKDKIFLNQLIPEVILALKEVNEKCRTLAYQMVVDIGKIFCQLLNPDTTFDINIREYLEIVLAGLAGSATQISATILALVKITTEYYSTLPNDLLDLILENMCILVKSRTREIVDSSLIYIRMFLKIFPIDIIGPKIEDLIKSLSEMSDDCKRHFRLKTRAIYLRFIRKFGYIHIARFVPETDEILRKRLKNIEKAESKRKRNKNDNDDSSDEDDNDTNTFVSRSVAKTFDEILDEVDDSDSEMEEQEKEKKGEAWIMESGEDIIDLMDPSITKNISMSNPVLKASQAEKKKAKTNPFKTAKDGRLIVKDTPDDDDDDDDDDHDHVDNHDNDSDSNESYNDEASTHYSMPNGMSRKRRRAAPSEVSATSSKYKPGGSGIHRSLKKMKISSNASVPGSEYRAQKAKGDIKKKGQVDPYAYVPLSRKSLNKRKRQKSSTQFSNVVKSMKKGVKKGAGRRK